MWIEVALLVLFSSVSASEKRERVNGIELASVGSNEERRVTTQIPWKSSFATCTLSFETGITTKQELHTDVQDILPEVVLRPLENQCLSFKNDFEYQVCIGKSVKQTLGKDHYALGEYHGFEGVEQIYKDGDWCEAGGLARETRIAFVCHSSKESVISFLSFCGYIFRSPL